MNFSGPTFESNFFQIEQVADGVYAAIIQAGRGAWGNAGIIDLGAKTLLFDSFFTPQAAQDLRRAAEILTGRAPSYVINSHFHADHVFGNQVFDDAVIIATPKTSELMSIDLPAIIEETRSNPHASENIKTDIEDPRLRKDREALAGEYRAIETALPILKVRLPDMTFEQRLVFQGTKYTAELLSFGGGHTPSDSMLYIPDIATAFTGDLVQVEFHPSMNTANPEEWLNILDQLGGLQLKHVIPGHGKVGTEEHVKIMKQYLLDLRQLVLQSRQGSATSEYLETINEPEKYSNWSASPVFQQNLRNMDRWYK